MTDERTATGVETTSVEGTSLPDPPDPETSTHAAPTDAASNGAPTARRRRRRGGRGRGSSGGARTAGAGDPDVEVDLDAQPGETDRMTNETIVEPTTVDGDGSTAEGETAAATPSGGRSRRGRRGGRGRGGRGRAATTTWETGSSTDETASEEGAASPATAAAAPTAARRRRRTTATSARSEGSADTSEDATAPAAEASAATEPGEGEATTTATGARRRRRRGGRGRGRKTSEPSETSDETAGAAPDQETPAGTTDATSTRTRRRKPARAEGEASETTPTRTRRRAAASATPTRTRTRTRATKAEGDGEAPTSTRLKRQRQSRQIRRRRDVMPAVERITDKLMVITEHGDRDQIAVLEERDLVQHYVTRQGARSMVGNVYLGRVQNVLPGMEAAFVDVGRGRNAVLYAGEVNWSPEDLEGAPPRIERVLKSGQSVLVQVTKDPIGGKGARLTAQLSLPGRYLVLAPNSNVTGISRRLPDAERKRLKSIHKKIKPEAHGLIVRTAAEGASEEALSEDLGRLVKTWEDIEKRAKKAKAPAVLYEEPELTLRVVRDLFTDEEYRELVTDSRRIFDLVTSYLRDIAPDVLSKVHLHEGKLSAFEEFHIIEQIHKGLDRKVWLPSGGYLVIDRTEALTVIDVNTGKSVGKTNLEETVVNTNVEAAREVARQLRLRDIGGMIVIDFIDMLLEQNKRKVIDAMKEAMARDKTRSQVFDISPLGLLEVTRKRVSGGLLESFSETCPTCEGRGVIITYDVN
jgi:ribonuclease E